MVIVEATGVTRFGHELGGDNLRPLVDVIHSEGAAAAIQLFADLPREVSGPDELSADEIRVVIEAFGNAAKICAAAGFDAVEVHGAHGFLLNKFFMPDQNHRTDAYGGSTEDRCRLGVEIVRRIHTDVADSLLILYRHTPEGEAYSIADSLDLAGRLEKAGLNVFHVSPARKESAADLARPFKECLNIAVIAVGGMEEPEAAVQALREERCDLVAIGKQMIADAQWPNKVREDRQEEVLECTQCGLCFTDLSEHRPVKCVLWDSTDARE